MSITKLTNAIFIILIFLAASCGTSAEDRAAAEQDRLDSIQQTKEIQLGEKSDTLTTERTE